MTDLKVGIRPYADPTTAGAAYEVRAFYGDGQDYGGDPVTGSLNAALAQWLIPIGAAPASYVASRGPSWGRRGRIHVDAVGAEIRSVATWSPSSPARSPSPRAG